MLDRARERVRAEEDGDLVAPGVALDEVLDPLPDVARLGRVVARRVELDGSALLVVRDERLLLATLVVLYEAVRGAADGVRRAVVLLEEHDLRPGEVLLEAEDVAYVRAPPAVDRLVRVTRRVEVPVLLREELGELVLGVVRVLVLIDEDVAEAVLEGLARVVMIADELDRLRQEVVEVERVPGLEEVLVDLESLGDDVLEAARGAAREVLGALEPVLGAADRVRHLGRRELLYVGGDLGERLADGAPLVGGVEDREPRLVADARRPAPEEPGAERVERRDRDGRLLSEELLDAFAHLARGLVGEGYGEDVPRRDSLLGEVGDASRDDARLPRARARDHEERAVPVLDGLSLGGRQVVEEGAHLP